MLEPHCTRIRRRTLRVRRTKSLACEHERRRNRDANTIMFTEMYWGVAPSGSGSRAQAAAAAVRTASA